MSVTTYDNLTSDPDTPNSGEVKLYMKNKAPAWRDDTGAVHTLQLPVFGNNVDLSIFEDYTMTTAGTTWDTYAGLQMPTGTAGTYLVFAHFHLRMSSASYDAWARLTKNGSMVGSQMTEELKDPSSNESMPRMLLRKIVLADGDYLDLDFATENTSGTLTVREGSIVLWRIA